MDNPSEHAPAPPELIKALEESDADLAAGRVVASEVVHERLRQTITEMEAEDAQRDGQPGRVAPGR